MKKFLIINLFFLFFSSSFAENNNYKTDNYFHIGKMESYNKVFTLYSSELLIKGTCNTYRSDQNTDLILLR